MQKPEQQRRADQPSEHNAGHLPQGQRDIYLFVYGNDQYIAVYCIFSSGVAALSYTTSNAI